MEPLPALTLSFLSSFVSTAERKSVLFVSENTSSGSVGVIPELTHSRPPLTRLNYTGIARYWPQAVAFLKPRGDRLSFVNFKGHGSFIRSPSLTLSSLRKERELMAYWEYCFLSLGFHSTFPMLPLEKHWKAAHSMAKHTARSCWCPWCLSICRPKIMAFIAQLVLTSMPVFWTRTLPPHCALCYAFLVDNESGIDGKGTADNISTLVRSGLMSLRLSLATSPCIFQQATLQGHKRHSSNGLNLSSYR